MGKQDCSCSFNRGLYCSTVFKVFCPRTSVFFKLLWLISRLHLKQYLLKLSESSSITLGSSIINLFKIHFNKHWRRRESFSMPNIVKPCHKLAYVFFFIFIKHFAYFVPTGSIFTFKDVIKYFVFVHVVIFNQLKKARY